MTSTIISTTRNVRISKKLAATFPAEVMAAIRAIQDAHPNIKSLTCHAVTSAHKFYVGEGYEFTLIYGEEAQSVEVAAEHNAGSAGQYHNIGHEFTAPVGAWVLVVSYYTRYFLDVYNIQPNTLPDDPKETPQAALNEGKSQQTERPTVSGRFHALHERELEKQPIEHYLAFADVQSENWDKPASEDETLAHFIDTWTTFDTTRLTIWRTRYGKWIDSTILERLVERGLVRKECNPERSMWVSPKYFLNV